MSAFIAGGGIKLKKVKWNIDELEKITGKFEYGVFYNLSSIQLLVSPEAEKIDWDECYEARFFSRDKELHIFEKDGEKRALLVEDEECDETVIKGYLLAKKFENVGKSILVKEYLQYDEDGQAYVALSRLCGVQ